MSKDNARARHRLKGRPMRGTAWLTEHNGESPRGRHRYVRTPSGGLMAVSAVLLAASAASSGVTAEVDVPPAPTLVEDEGAGGNSAPRASFPRAAMRSKTASDEIVHTIPVSYTGSIPSTVLDAYRRAHERTNLVQPNCHIPLELLAAIGKIESGHARGGKVDAAGRTISLILGPVLNGGAFAAIRDTDGGALDGDTTWDRAVGPMQFIPGTWARWAADGNVDGRTDPHNVYDASLAAARYLCAANRDLGTPAGLDAAVLSYNHSTSYLSLVRSWMTVYRNGTVEVGDLSFPLTDPVAQAGIPPALPPITPPGTPPVTPPPTAPPATPPATPPTTPPTGPPTTPPTTPPTEPPTTPPTTPPTEPPTTPPTTPPTEPPPTPPTTDPNANCGLVGGLLGTVGGLLGAPNQSC